MICDGDEQWHVIVSYLCFEMKNRNEEERRCCSIHVQERRSVVLIYPVQKESPWLEGAKMGSTY